MQSEPAAKFHAQVLAGKVATLLLGIAVLTVQGCKEERPGRGTGSTNELLSLQMLDGVVAQTVGIVFMGQDVQATVFAKDLGASALFLWYYRIPAGAEGKDRCIETIEAEIARCVENTQAEILSRKQVTDTELPTSEVLAKLPRNRELTIRCRVICNGKEIHSLTAITPVTLDVNQAQAVDKMFDEFRIK